MDTMLLKILRSWSSSFCPNIEKCENPPICFRSPKYIDDREGGGERHTYSRVRDLRCFSRSGSTWLISFTSRYSSNNRGELGLQQTLKEIIYKR